jgi:enoyl-CoA hydratase
MLRSERRRAPNGAVEILTIDRPRRLNAIDSATLDALAARLEAIGASDEVRAVVVSGAGDRAFCAGADVGELAGLSALGAHAVMERGQRVMAALEMVPQPTVAAVNGYALGGGLELALACDFRLAAVSARFGQPEITLGHIPGWGATQRLSRIAGEAVAKDLVLSGRVIDAGAALELGLVHRVHPDAELQEAALALAEDLAGRAPAALALAKRAILAARGGGAAAYEVERQGVARCITDRRPAAGGAAQR